MSERHVEVRTEKIGHNGMRPRNWDEVVRDAEFKGIDVGREFRARFHLAQGYVEFWQPEVPLVTTEGARLESKPKRAKKPKKGKAAA